MRDILVMYLIQLYGSLKMTCVGAHPNCIYMAPTDIDFSILLIYWLCVYFNLLMCFAPVFSLCTVSDGKARSDGYPLVSVVWIPSPFFFVLIVQSLTFTCKLFEMVQNFTMSKEIYFFVQHVGPIVYGHRLSKYM